LKVSDVLAQKGLLVHREADINPVSPTSPPPPPKILVVTASIVYQGRQVIQNNIKATGLTFDQGGVTLSEWKEES